MRSQLAIEKFHRSKTSRPKATTYTIASNELIADGMSFEDMLGTALTQSIGYGLDTAFLQGTGTGQPLGVLNADALITVAKESSQPAATIVYENCANMLGRLHRNCWKNAVWVVNNTALPQLLRMTLNVKTVDGSQNVGGSAVPVFAQTPRGYTMFGMPVLLTEKLPVVGTVGDILLADFTQYAIGIRKQLSIERNTFVGWQTDESGYRAIVRVDGQPKWNKPYTPKNGLTLSCFVTLATRS
jgi:HK97 family phage major capsid protein